MMLALFTMCVTPAVPLLATVPTLCTNSGSHTQLTAMYSTHAITSDSWKHVIGPKPFAVVRF